MGAFPVRRLRRLRASEGVRALLRETRLAAEDLIQPVFVAEAPTAAGAIHALPGVVRHTLASLDGEIDRVSQSGVRAVLLFGVPAAKAALGSGARRDDSIVGVAVSR